MISDPHEPTTFDAPMTATEIGAKKNCHVLSEVSPVSFNLSKIPSRFYILQYNKSSPMATSRLGCHSARADEVSFMEEGDLSA